MKYIIATLSYFLTLVVLHRMIGDPVVLTLVAVMIGASAGLVFEKSNIR